MRRFFWLSLLLTASVTRAAGIPPPPSGEDYVWDDAGLLDAADEATLRELQRQSLDAYNSPLVVVTISSTSEYGGGDLEGLARRWFDAWRIGTLGLEGGANQGMLLLVAVSDRRARIELGGDWGHAWDAHAQTIMSEAIVPRFKKGEYSGGIVAGARGLLEMAKQGPHSKPPGDFLAKARRYSLLDPTPFLFMMGLGFALVLLGAFTNVGSKRWLIGGGLALIVFALFSYVVLVLLVLVFGRRGGSGRGFSGGFSGGGGASGSW